MKDIHEKKGDRQRHPSRGTPRGAVDSAAEARPLKDLVSRLIEKIRGEKTIDEEELDLVWKKASGEAGYRHSRPVSLYKRTLRVIVENPGWIQDLTFRKRKILRELQRCFGREKVSDIRFKIGDLGERGSSRSQNGA